MSFLRDVWDYATYRTPEQNPALWWRDLLGVDFAGRPMATEFGPTVYTLHPALVETLHYLASPAELRRVAAALSATETHRAEMGVRRVAAALEG